MIDIRRMPNIASVILIIFILGYWLDGKNIISQWKQANLLEKKSEIQWAVEENLLKQEPVIQKNLQHIKDNLLPHFRLDNPAHVTTELLTTIMRCAELNGVGIQMLQPVAWHPVLGIQALIIHLSAVSYFSQFSQFILSLTQYSLPILLQDFNLHTEKNGLIKMDFQLAGFYVPSIQPNLPSFPNWLVNPKMHMNMNNKDPFHSDAGDQNELTNQINHSDLLLQTVSLQQIKWVGFIKKDKKYWALMMLPNKKTISLNEGATFGIDKIKIIKINEKEVVIKTGERSVRMPYFI